MVDRRQNRCPAGVKAFSIPTMRPSALLRSGCWRSTIQAPASSTSSTAVRDNDIPGRCGPGIRRDYVQRPGPRSHDDFAAGASSDTQDLQGLEHSNPTLSAQMPPARWLNPVWWDWNGPLPRRPGRCFSAMRAQRFDRSAMADLLILAANCPGLINSCPIDRLRDRRSLARTLIHSARGSRYMGPMGWPCGKGITQDPLVRSRGQFGTPETTGVDINWILTLQE